MRMYPLSLEFKRSCYQSSDQILIWDLKVDVICSCMYIDYLQDKMKLSMAAGSFTHENWDS